MNFINPLNFLKEYNDSVSQKQHTEYFNKDLTLILTSPGGNFALCEMLVGATSEAQKENNKILL